MRTVLGLAYASQGHLTMAKKSQLFLQRWHRLAKAPNASNWSAKIPRNLAPNLTHYLGEHTKEDRNL
jgi:hypothetical protein